MVKQLFILGFLDFYWSPDECMSKTPFTPDIKKQQHAHPLTSAIDIHSRVK